MSDDLKNRALDMAQEWAHRVCDEDGYITVGFLACVINCCLILAEADRDT